MAEIPSTLFDCTRVFIQSAGRYPLAERDAIVQAFYLASTYHGEQRRKSGELYIIHPLQVSLLLMNAHLDQFTIEAGLLHDVLEDTAATSEQIKRHCGKEVTALVEAVTRFPMFSRKEFVEKVYDKATRDPRVAALKLADRIANLMHGSQLVFTAEKHLAHLEETEEFYVKQLAAVPGIPASLIKSLRVVLDQSWVEYRGRS